MALHGFLKTSLSYYKADWSQTGSPTDAGNLEYTCPVWEI